MCAPVRIQREPQRGGAARAFFGVTTLALLSFIVEAASVRAMRNCTAVHMRSVSCCTHEISIMLYT